MKNKGLTMSFVFEAESANYGEGVGNVTSLKKISRSDQEMYTYISRQALRYNLVDQMGISDTPLGLDKSVIQFHPEATISDYPEIDLFGYMKTVKPSKTRSAVVRLSNAVALESYNTDLEFLTNKGLFDRYKKTSETQDDIKGGNIAQSEIHKSFYTYTITVDLDKVGIDENDQIEISNEEKFNRITALLKAIKFLYRDIKGRRENLSPVFAIGGVYDYKNPFFENRIKLDKSAIELKTLKSVLELDEEVKTNTFVGLVEGIFSNDQDMIAELDAKSIKVFFEKVEGKIKDYYLE